MIPEQAVRELNVGTLLCTPASLDLEAAHYMARFDGDDRKWLGRSLVQVIKAARAELR